MKLQFTGLMFVLCLAFILVACGTVSDAPSTEQGNSPVEDTSSGEVQIDQNKNENSTDEMDAPQTPVQAEMMDEMNSSSDLVVDKDTLMRNTQEEAVDQDVTQVEDQMMENKPAFFNAQLIDAVSRETFTLNDFQGKIVLVETLAMWCSNCLKQQLEVKVLHELIGENDDFVSVGLDIDPNENLDDLSGYVLNNGFDWLYAVAPVEVAREIGQIYGSQFLNPPSTPMFIIDRNGVVHPLPFGIKSADQLYREILPFLNGEM